MRRTENGRYLAKPAGFEAISFSAVQYNDTPPFTGGIFVGWGTGQSKLVQVAPGILLPAKEAATCPRAERGLVPNPSTSFGKAFIIRNKKVETKQTL